MLTVGFPAQAFGTNCYVVAPNAGEECVIIDPGIGVLDTLQQVLAQHRLKPAAVLLTHGHLDHTFSVTPVCGAQGIPAVIHASDGYRLSDPITTLGPELRAMLSQSFGPDYTWAEPSDVRYLADTEPIDYAGLQFEVLHAPGHTEGSVMFHVDHVPHEAQGAPELTSTLVSGDVLFAGSIGRTDLPGGSMTDMMASLRDVVLPLPDTALVLPGHGPATTIAQERNSNPYLMEAAQHG